MESKIRKPGDIWNIIDNQRLQYKMNKNEWKQSYIGVKTVLNHIGLELITTKEEFEKLDIPIDRNNFKKYTHRKIIVSRNGIISSPTIIQHLISGQSGLLTEDEKNIIYDKQSKALSIIYPKGIAKANNQEAETIDALNIKLNMSSIFDIIHLDEFRLTDICFKEYNSNDNLYYPEQIKTATSGKDGRLSFGYNSSKLSVKIMKSIINTGISLICIGKNAEGIIEVVWFFYGQKSLNMLSEFDDNQIFNPILHLKMKSFNKFTLEYNKSEYRFDLRNKEECDRLFKYRSEIITSGTKYTLKYLNEDDSQIPSETHRKEHKSFAFIRDACAKRGVIIQKKHEEAHSSIDFTVNESRIQDKIAKNTVNIRGAGHYPMNPDSIDVLQINLGKVIYVINMRTMDYNNNLIVSTLSTAQLMITSVRLTNKWKNSHKQYMHDLSTIDGIKSYISACEKAKNIPKLSDPTFYDKIIKDNADIFTEELKKKRQSKINKKLIK